METLNWRDRLKKSQWVNGITLYLAGVLSLAIVAYGCKALLSLL
jgi:hypothetical protein